MTRGSRDVHLDVALLVLSAAVAAVYLTKGVGFVLDDWFFLRNAELDGAWHAAGSTGGDRPVGALVYIVFFGFIGPHPAALVVLLAVGNGVSAIVLRRLVQKRFGTRLSFIAAALWLLLPLRTSLEIWFSTGTACLATVLALLGVRYFEANEVRWSEATVGAALVTAGILSYEAVGMLAVVAAAALRWRRGPRPYTCLALLVVLSTAALAWAFTHRLPGRRSPGGLADPLNALRANFGIGITGSEALAMVTLLAAGLGTVLVATRSTTPRHRAAIGVGWAGVMIGVLPFATYFYSPFGAGDRLNLLSAFGAALVWAALYEALWEQRRLAGTVALAALAAVAVVARVERSELWSRAGRDGERVISALVREHPAPPTRVVLGPEPILVDSIGAFVDQSNANAAVQFAYRTRSVVGALAYSEAAYTEAGRDEGTVLIDLLRLSSLDELDNSSS